MSLVLALALGVNKPPAAHPGSPGEVLQIDSTPTRVLRKTKTTQKTAEDGIGKPLVPSP